MDVRPPSATLAKTSTSTWCAPARNRALAQPSAVAPDVTTSSTRISLRPATSALPSAGTRNAPWMLAARCARESPTCWGGRFYPLERVRRDRHAARLGYGSRQQRRLIETPRPMPPPVQRHRHQRIRLGQQLAAGLGEPAAHHRREIEPVAIFERVHQRARYLVETHRCAGAPVSRRVGDRLHGQNAGPGIVDERMPSRSQ
jgi:hypothetical protein